MSIFKTIEANPISTIVGILAIFSTVFTVLTYVIFNNIQPLTVRISAVELSQTEIKDLSTDLTTIKEKVSNIEKSQSKMDLKIDTLIGFRQ